jgi:hypothetical protein
MVESIIGQRASRHAALILALLVASELDSPIASHHAQEKAVLLVHFATQDRPIRIHIWEGLCSKSDPRQECHVSGTLRLHVPAETDVTVAAGKVKSLSCLSVNPHRVVNPAAIPVPAPIAKHIALALIEIVMRNQPIVSGSNCRKTMLRAPTSQEQCDHITEEPFLQLRHSYRSADWHCSPISRLRYIFLSIQVRSSMPRTDPLHIVDPQFGVGVNPPLLPGSQSE